MGGERFTDAMEPALRPLLAAGERLLAASPLVKDPGSTEDVALREELTNLLDPTILLGLGTHPGELLNRAAFGRALVGGPESIAGRLFGAVSDSSGPYLVVTDLRLSIVEMELRPRGTGLFARLFGPSDRLARSVFELDRRAVLGAHPAPAGALRRGRLLVGCADRSACALVCATAGQRDQAVASLGPLGAPPD